MDEKDFIFISKPLGPQKDKTFRDFIKTRKSKVVRVKEGKEFQG